MSHTMNPRQVLLNILQLKVAVLLKKTGTDDRQGQREYLALLNEKIGAMFFAKSVLGWNELYEKIQDLGEDEKDWRRVRLRVNRKRTESDNFFLVDENDHKLDTNNLSDTARRVAELTLRLLNHKSKQVKHIEGPIENIVLEDLDFFSEIFILEIKEHIAWAGKISRERAEEMLKGKPQGSYLLRQDSDASIKGLLKNLVEEYKHLFFYFLLTYVSKKGGVGEKLLLKDGGWFLYDDIPDPEYYKIRKFSDLNSLLDTIKEAKIPISCRKQD